MAKNKSVYVCILMEETKEEKEDVVFAVAATLQKAKKESNKFWHELNKIYPMPSPEPQEWEAVYQDNNVYYVSGQFLIQRFALL